MIVISELEAAAEEVQKRYAEVQAEANRLEGEFRRLAALIEQHKGENVNPQDQPGQPAQVNAAAPAEQPEVQSAPEAQVVAPAEAQVAAAPEAQAPATEAAPVEAQEAAPVAAEEASEASEGQAVEAPAESTQAEAPAEPQA